jgi:eukaryotic translation initiation factor 2C
VLSYGQSEYVRQFGMNVNDKMIEVTARVLDPPTLKYGPGSKQATIRPAHGAWNMADKKFFRPSVIKKWVIVVYESERRFNQDVARQMAINFVSGARAVGMTVQDSEPPITWENGQGNIGNQLRKAGQTCVQQKGEGPNLIVVILPDGGDDIYTAVKHFGDVTMGIATQCLLAKKCFRANAQYWANVMLKINVKLDGINSVPDLPSLTDPAHPTIIMGADVIHPAPGAEGRPSFTALVASVDTTVSKYVALSRVQTGRQEMIDDLEEMCKEGLTKWHGYRAAVEKNNQKPARLFFYRDGVSEGQFQQVLDIELPMIKRACAALKITPKITLVVVGKRHHIRMCPVDSRDADRSGNCPAGTTIDAGLGHPTEFDYYQQSHGGLLGTSRPAHYSVIHDENNMTADAMQATSFALTHVYARATRSVSIPAPVYYADIVCSRAKNHYNPAGNLHLSESATHTEATSDLQAFKQGFVPLNPKQSGLMYFM